MKKKIINILLLIIWILFIFIMSSFNADKSSMQSGLIVDILSNIFHISNIDLLTIIIRKLAHITEYLILGILMINCLKDYKINKLYLVSILLCIIYSMLDEFHQTFINGRSGEIQDILIDTIGIITGILIYNLLLKKIYHNNFKSLD